MREWCCDLVVLWLHVAPALDIGGQPAGMLDSYGS
jgi:hypothetical protein